MGKIYKVSDEYLRSYKNISKKAIGFVVVLFLLAIGFQAWSVFSNFKLNNINYISLLPLVLVFFLLLRLGSFKNLFESKIESLRRMELKLEDDNIIIKNYAFPRSKVSMPLEDVKFKYKDIKWINIKRGFVNRNFKKIEFGTNLLNSFELVGFVESEEIYNKITGKKGNS